MRRRSFLWGSILVLFLLAGIGGGIYYGYQQLNYISVRHRPGEGTHGHLTADATGKLDWKVHSGDVVQADEVIGSLSPIPSPLCPSSPFIKFREIQSCPGAPRTRKSNPQSAEPFWRAFRLLQWDHHRGNALWQ